MAPVVLGESYPENSGSDLLRSRVGRTCNPVIWLPKIRGVIGDTIFAVASPTGAAERGVLRISGPRALHLASEVLEEDLKPKRAVVESAVTVLGHRVPCLVLVMIAPRSYTGEDVVELHLPGSPLLLEKLGSRLRNRGRDALPGEFTRRAYENNRAVRPRNGRRRCGP